MGGGSVRAPGPGQATPPADVIRCGPGLVLTYWGQPSTPEPSGRREAPGPGQGPPPADCQVWAGSTPSPPPTDRLTSSTHLQPSAREGRFPHQAPGRAAQLQLHSGLAGHLHGGSSGDSEGPRVLSGHLWPAVSALWAPPQPRSDGADTIITDPPVDTGGSRGLGNGKKWPLRCSRPWP